MPEVYVHVVKGRTFEQKKALVQDITSAVMKHMNAPADAVVVTDHRDRGRFQGQGRRDVQRARPLAGFESRRSIPECRSHSRGR